MNKITFFFDDLELAFDLIPENNTISIWKQMIKQYSPADMRQDNHKVGFVTFEEMLQRTERLYFVAESINKKIPGGIEIIRLDENTWKEALNKMHVHFPTNMYSYNMSQEEFNNELLPFLSEYNDLIHILEKEYDRFYGSKINSSIIHLDFNWTKESLRAPIPEDGWNLFQRQFYFGDLLIHYAHIGRHPFELFTARDYDCPAHQALSQFNLSPCCAIRLGDQDKSRIEKFGSHEAALQDFNTRFEEFYNVRGGKNFFKFDLNDPKLAVGYMKAGRLQNFEKYEDLAERDSLRSKLKSTTLLGWEVE